jgi:hypothetical protein
MTTTTTTTHYDYDYSYDDNNPSIHLKGKKNNNNKKNNNYYIINTGLQACIDRHASTWLSTAAAAAVLRLYK